jgi:hypothetical protein
MVVIEFNKFCFSKSEAEKKAEEKGAAKDKSQAPGATPGDDEIKDIELNKSIGSDDEKKPEEEE